MSSRFVYLRPTRLVFVRQLGAYETSVVAAWERLYSWMRQRGLQADGGSFYGLVRDNPAKVPAGKCRYDACIELPLNLDTAAMAEIQVQRLPAGAYSRHKYVGRYDNIAATTLPICNEQIPALGLRVAEERPMVVIYMADPLRRDADQLKAEICVPVSAMQQAGDLTAA